MTACRSTGLFVVLLALSGCGTAPLVPITYDEPVATTANLAASVILNTERVIGHESSTMVYAGGVFVPVSSGPVPGLQFGKVDQTTFKEGKKKAATKLLSLLIRDIEGFVAQAVAMDEASKSTI